MQWGWRIPFLLSVLLVGVGLYIRLRIEETPVFRQIKAKNEVSKIPLVEIFKYHRRPFFTAVGLKISETAYATIAGVFVISYATSKLGLSRNLILNGAFIASLVALCSIPLFGWLSDRVVAQDDVLRELSVLGAVCVAMQSWRSPDWSESQRSI
jgi:MHS family shikimate/dehydroshikimate transporter-like MFS transporter